MSPRKCSFSWLESTRELAKRRYGVPFNKQQGLSIMWFGSSIELAYSLVKIEVAIELNSGHRPRSLQHLLGNVFMFVSAFFFPHYEKNRPFPSSPHPPFQSEAKCEVFVMKIRFYSY